MTLAEVAANLYCSSSKISRIETARVTATIRDVRDMLELYGADGPQREGLIQLALDARRKESWWQAYGDVPDIRTFVDLEGAAESILVWEQMLIPGLLQIREYARIVLSNHFPHLLAPEISRLVDLRMVRQAALQREGPAVLRAVIDEAALQRLAHERSITQGQVRHLLKAAELPNVSYRVLPYTVGLHTGMSSPFTILRFAEPTDLDVVHVEHSAGELYLDRPDQAQRYQLLFERLEGLALTPEESVRLVGKLADPLLS